jgi:spore photoproduct lyase
MDKDSKPPKEKDWERTQAEAEMEEAEMELRRELEKASEREYQRMAADLRWAVLDFIDANPDMALTEVARHFGLKEGSIRAWKAHVTMGTYRQDREREEKRAEQKQQRLFAPMGKRGIKPGFIERKRYTRFIHYFDKTPEGIVCPHFFILAHANGCPYECQYCYLNLTLRHYPSPTVFSNTARMFQEIRDWLLSQEKPSVLNSGELSDSLAWDEDTGLSLNLVPLFADQKRHKLLMLTKSTKIKNLLKLSPTGRVIISFSINAPEVSRRFEKKSPSPLKRLQAAAKLKAAGWSLRLRLDPIIPVEDWPRHYQELIEPINELEPETVTLGTLRYFKNLLNFARYGSEVFKYGQDQHDPDDRIRIPFKERKRIYEFFMERLKVSKIGLCKETQDMHHELGLPGSKQSCNCSYD